MARIELGKTYRCTVTGFVGVATGRTEFLGGNERAMLQSRQLQDGVPTRAVWMEAPQLIEVGRPAVQAAKAGTAPAGKPAAENWPPAGTRPFRSN